MAYLGVSGAGRNFARVFLLGASCVALANCSSGNMAGRIDPRYGVAASARVVEPGQPVPKGGGVYRVGKPYAVAGRVYVPEENINYSAVGLASWYGNDFHGRYTANGEIFDMNGISAAHPTLPLPSYARITNLANNRSIIVRVNDRGPYVGNRLIDVSVKTAELLGFYGHGVTRVKVEYVGRAPLEGSDDRKLVATLRQGKPADAPLLLASSRPTMPTYSNERPLNKFAAGAIPTPSGRPYRLGESIAESSSTEEASTTELAAAARPRTAGAAARIPASDFMPGASPVSAYASGGYDGRSSFMSGRGLY